MCGRAWRIFIVNVLMDPSSSISGGMLGTNQVQIETDRRLNPGPGPDLSLSDPCLT